MSDSKKYRKPTEEELRQKLTPLQYEVTQDEGTERAFQNEYWDNKRPGIYVDVATGEPLFSSLDKYDSGTGWPSFTKPLESENVTTRVDKSLFFQPRTEVRSSCGGSHLGHVFDDGPGPDGKRYCMNSAAMRFVPLDRLEAEGYGQFKALFEKGSSAPGSAPLGWTPPRAGLEVAVLAGGCFWGVQELLRALPGVVETDVGYSGGQVPDVRYEQVKTGRTGHAEAVRIIFDPARLKFEDLLRFFFRLHDPTSFNRQGNDLGSQYRSVVFYLTEAQKLAAEKIRSEVDQSGKWKKPVVTAIDPAADYYLAEGDHQDYLQKNPGGYTCHYLRD